MIAGWTMTTVGCHWTRGEYTISTQTGGNQPSGYALYREGHGQIGVRFPTFDAAAAAATRDSRPPTVSKKDRPTVSRSATENWTNNAIQFPRLIAELFATVELSPEQINALLETMDLERAQLDELIDRADLVWQDIKERTR